MTFMIDAERKGRGPFMIKIGDTITLKPKYADDGEQYRCKLVERRGNNLYIDYPVNMKTNRTSYLFTGTQLKATFISQDGTVYLFETEIIDRVKVKLHIPVLLISYPGGDELVRIQRRKYVRVETPLDVAVHPLEGGFEPFTTITEDISAGGAAILISNKIQMTPNQLLRTVFVLPMQSGDYHYMDLKSKVIRLIPMNGNREKVSLQFIDITEKQKQIILRLCFERQLAMRKKGLT